MRRPPVPPLVLLELDDVVNDAAYRARVAAGATWEAMKPFAHVLLDPVRVARVDRIGAATGASIVLVGGWSACFDPPALRRLLRRAGLRTPVRRCISGGRLSADLRAYDCRRYLGHVGATQFVVIDAAIQHWCLRVHGRPASEAGLVLRPTGRGAVRRYRVPPWLQERAVFPSPACGLTEADVDAAVAALRLVRPFEHDPSCRDDGFAEGR